MRLRVNPSQAWPAGRIDSNLARGPDFGTLCTYSSPARGPTHMSNGRKSAVFLRKRFHVWQRFVVVVVIVLLLFFPLFCFAGKMALDSWQSSVSVFLSFAWWQIVFSSSQLSKLECSDHYRYFLWSLLLSNYWFNYLFN